MQLDDSDEELLQHLFEDEAWKDSKEFKSSRKERARMDRWYDKSKLIKLFLSIIVVLLGTILSLILFVHNSYSETIKQHTVDINGLKIEAASTSIKLDELLRRTERIEKKVDQQNGH